ncbi:MAG: hypothetical protein JW384_04175 [Nitrosomonadaceae bacterium]|nr:hypothetical protein [Nitrosomonadaceae bacterium]
MKNKRQTYYLHINQVQMKELLATIKDTRQAVAALGDQPQRLTRLKGLQRAIEQSVYFYNKHNTMEIDKDGDWLLGEE